MVDPLSRRVRYWSIAFAQFVVCFASAQDPITVTSQCLGQVAAEHHSLAMGPVGTDWFGPVVKSVPLGDGGSVAMYRYIAGPDTGVQVTRFDSMGATVWNYSFTDPGVPYLHPTTICQANDLGYLIGGQTAGYTNVWDPFILKLDADGNFLWFKTYTCNRNLFVNDIAQSSSGNICMVGGDYFLLTAFWASPWNNGFDANANAAVVLVTDGAGAPLSFTPYSFHFGGVDRKWENFCDVEAMPDGSFLIAGNSGHNWDFFTATALHIDNSGGLLWCRNWLCTQFGGTWSSDVAQSVVAGVTPGTALISGYVSDHNQYGTGWSYRDAYAAQIDIATGDLNFSKRYPMTAANIIDSELSNGRLLIVGRQFTSAGLSGGVLYDVDAATGTLGQMRTYHFGSSPGTSIACIDAYANGDLLLAGNTGRNGFQQAIMLKTDALGAATCTDSLWETPGDIDLVWTEKFMTINDPGGLNPSPLTTIPTVAVDRTLIRNCVCLKVSTFCPLPLDTLFTLDKDTLACSGDSLHIASDLEESLQCGDPQFTYAWEYFSDGVVVNNGVVGGTSFATSGQASPPGLTAPDGSVSVQVQLRVIDCAGDTICKVAASVGIGGFQTIDEVLAADTVFCGAALQLGPGSTDPDATFSWYATTLDGDLAQAQAGGVVSTSALYSAGSTGTYFLLSNVHGCISIDSILVDMDRLTIDLADSAWFCKNDNVLLDATWPGATSYLWSGVVSSDSATAMATTAGNAIVMVHVANCVGADTIAVAEHPLPVFNLPDEVPLCIDTRIAHLVITDPHDSLVWSTGETTSWINATETGYVSASIFVDGCHSEMDSTLVYLEDCTCTLYVPNSFTPDGDGVNDAWAPVMDCDLRYMDLLLFNRWGELIAELKEPADRWDGTYGGQQCPIGVYAYKLRYSSIRLDQEQTERSEVFGHVSLLR
ncbi:MAG: gliding motility-associated C-terminal domain-containing protein [Flavobacteriales bacterium]|nr:gliding motility-associated C-terminal domain-containing protein [Flavobacteriales bacterium]MBK6945123.1 gliding motility-associated C-terminal domain-containing protein [Flavobacteriales bacterium]MBK7296016.1 gliding motility-associated C-terminal domain-containing protein [Flavobacteriales bacterium]MBP9138779.1 gliding motility-associated C-terminal domain-containing protein [Flavobacteriales bacterium]HQX38638.1 gliding motility-associated C-terminal domain-containing protein [Flavobac